MKAIVRLGLLIVIPICAYGEFRAWLDVAPLSNDIRITLLIYMAIAWTEIFVEDK